MNLKFLKCFIEKVYVDITGPSFADKHFLNLVGSLAQKLIWILVVSRVDPLIELLIDSDDDVKGSLLHC